MLPFASASRGVISGVIVLGTRAVSNVKEILFKVGEGSVRSSGNWKGKVVGVRVGE